jgi:hypothetical protein
LGPNICIIELVFHSSHRILTNLFFSVIAIDKSPFHNLPATRVTMFYNRWRFSLTTTRGTTFYNRWRFSLTTKRMTMFYKWWRLSLTTSRVTSLYNWWRFSLITTRVTTLYNWWRLDLTAYVPFFLSFLFFKHFIHIQMYNEQRKWWTLFLPTQISPYLSSGSQSSYLRILITSLVYSDSSFPSSHS